jgi:predicted RND superfamily exporter protein
MNWKKMAEFILGKKIYFLFGILAFTLTMGYFATKVELEYTMAELVPSNHPDLQVYRKFKERYGEEGNRLVCAFKAKDIFEFDFCKDLYQTIDSLKQIHGIQGVLSPVSASFLHLDSSDVFQMKSLFDEFPQTQEELNEKAALFNELKFYQNRIFNKDSKVALMVLILDPKVMDSPEKVALIRAATSYLERFGERHAREMHISGLPFVRYKNATTIKNEILLFTALAFLITALLIFLLFRSLSTLFVSLLFIGIGVLTMLGISGIFAYKLNVLTGILPPLLVVVGVQNTIYLINAYHDRFRHTQKKYESLIHVISHVGIANFLINFTTSVGFGTFYFTHTAILERFGTVAFITINLLFFINIIGVPIVYSYLPKPSLKQIKHLDNRGIGRFLAWAEGLVFRRKRRIFYWFSVLVILGTIFIFRLKPLAFMVDDIPQKSKIYQDLQFIQEHFHGAMPYEILVSSYEEGAVRDVPMLSKVKKLQRALEEFPELSKPMSIVEVISAANQAAHDNDPRYYRIPSSLELGNLAMKIPAPTESVQPKNDLFKGLIDSSFTQLRISYQMKDVGSASMDSLSDQIEQIARDIFPAEEYKVSITGITPIFLKGNAFLYESLMKATFWSLLIISLTMTFLFPSWRMVLIAIIPNFVPLVLTAGTMGFMGVPLKPSTILIFSISFGITVDSTIHFVSTFRKEIIQNARTVRVALAKTMQQVGHSMMYSAVAVCSGFVIFVFSEFKGTESMGWLTGLTILGGLAANLLLLPALILAFEKFINPKIELKESLLDFDEDEEKIKDIN